MSLGLRVWGLGFRVWALGLGFRVVPNMTIRVQVPNNHVLTKTCTIITITQIPSTSLLGTWPLRVNSMLLTILQIKFGLLASWLPQTPKNRMLL